MMRVGLRNEQITCMWFANFFLKIFIATTPPALAAFHIFQAFSGQGTVTTFYPRSHHFCLRPMALEEFHFTLPMMLPKNFQAVSKTHLSTKYSLVPRPSSRAVDPLPEKVKREEGLVKLITRLTSRVERR